jgi:hypothetical protein
VKSISATTEIVIARSAATWQSLTINAFLGRDCFAALAMTALFGHFCVFSHSLERGLTHDDVQSTPSLRGKPTMMLLFGCSNALMITLSVTFVFYPFAHLYFHYSFLIINFPVYFSLLVIIL